MKQIFIVVAVLLTGCASHNWAPAAGKDPNQFTSDKARCSIMARHGNQTSWYAYGKTEQVAAYGLGVAIGDAVGANQDFNDCMQLMGWEIADDHHAERHVVYELNDGRQVIEYPDQATISSVLSAPDAVPGDVEQSPPPAVRPGKQIPYPE